MVFVNEMERTERGKREWLENILDKIGKALYTTDADGILLDINDVALDFLGQRKDEVIGRPISKVVPLHYSKDDSKVKLPIADAYDFKRVFTVSQGMYLRNQEGQKEFATYSVVPCSMLGSEGCVMVMMGNYDFGLNPTRNPQELLVSSTSEHGKPPLPAFYTKREGQFVRVLIRDILWIEAMENYAQLVTEHDRFVVHSTMKGLIGRIKEQGFSRVHRSFIVPIDRVDAIEENRLYIGMKEIPIGKSFRQELMKTLNFI